VGLSPSARLAQQAGAAVRFVPEAGGWVALHSEHMETTVPGIYIAGDAANIEEASAAMVEGKIAGLHAANAVSSVEGYWDIMSGFLRELEDLRRGEFGERPRRAKEVIHRWYNEVLGNRDG